MRQVLVTGATGFVAAATIPALRTAGWNVVAAVRRSADVSRLPPGCSAVPVGDIGPLTEWSAALSGIGAVVHLAARVHQDERGAGADEAHDRVNTQGTRALAEACARAGVPRLVYLSSVKAMGAGSPPGEPWTGTSPCRPVDAYGRSKLAAEEALAGIAAASGLSCCVLRPPLVYGPGARANVERLRVWIAAGRPLPFGGVNNRRSLIFVGNLADAIARAVDRPDVTGVFVVRDGEDLSTPELARRLGLALGRPARLVPVPARLVRKLAGAVGRSRGVDRLFGDLAVDDAELRRQMDWRPPFTVDEGLALLVAAAKRRAQDGLSG